MKNSNNVFLINLLLLLNLVFFALPLKSQEDIVFLNGFSYRARVFNSYYNHEIKNVEITNLGTGHSIEHSKSWISKSELITAGIENDKSDINGFHLVDIRLKQNNISFNVYSNDVFNLKLIIFDFAGNEILNKDFQLQNGFNNIEMMIPNLSNGLYNISFKNINSFYTFRSTIIINENEIYTNKLSNHFEPNQKQSLSSGIGYRFIAYPVSPFHLPDTVVIESLDGISKIEFFFKDKSQFNFRTGIIKLSNLSAETIKYGIFYNTDNTEKGRDTSFFKRNYNLDYILGVQVVSPPFITGCNEVFNFNNQIRFCNIYFSGDSYAPYYSRFGATIEINTENKTLFIKDLSEEKSIGANGFGVNDKLYSIFRTSENIPYTINPVTGELEAELNLENIEFFFSYKVNATYRNRDFENDYLISQFDEKLLSYKANSSTKLTIVLNP